MITVDKIINKIEKDNDGAVTLSRKENVSDEEIIEAYKKYRKFSGAYFNMNRPSSQENMFFDLAHRFFNFFYIRFTECV